MQIDFSKRLIAIDGSELADNGKPITLGGVSVAALLANYPDENTTGDVKAERWKLAQRIFSADAPATVTVEEVVILKKLIGAAYGPVVVGQAYALLNG
jgi:hypothetical protein